MSDWLQADDYTTLEEVFASPDFTRAPTEALGPRSAFVATAAAARRPLRSLRNRAIASLSLAGAAVSFVGAVIIGSGPVGVPLASAPSNPQATGGAAQTPAGSQQPGPGAPGGGAGSGTGTNTGNSANGSGSGAVSGPSLPGSANGSGGAAAGGTLHASLVSDTFPAPAPAPAPTTTTPPVPTTTTTTPPISAGGVNSRAKGFAGGHDNGGGNGGQNNGHGNGT